MHTSWFLSWCKSALSRVQKCKLATISLMLTDYLHTCNGVTPVLNEFFMCSQCNHACVEKAATIYWVCELKEQLWSCAKTQPNTIPFVPAVTLRSCVGKRSSHFRPESLCQSVWFDISYQETFKLKNRSWCFSKLQKINIWEIKGNSTNQDQNTVCGVGAPIIIIIYLFFYLLQQLNKAHIHRPEAVSQQPLINM